VSSAHNKDHKKQAQKRHRRDSRDSYDNYDRRDRRDHKSRHKKDRKKKEKDSMASHPYFVNKEKSKVAKKYDENGNELFWDGFQWVPRQTQRSYFNPMQELFI